MNQLTAEEYGWLRQLGLNVELAPIEHRQFAITTVVTAAARCRSHAGWAEIALAIGVTEDRLRLWRGQVRSTNKRVALAESVPTVVPSNRPDPSVLLILTGHPGFATEIAGIRQRCDGFLKVVPVPCASLDEVGRSLDDYRPNLLHIAAHCAYGAVDLHSGGSAIAVLLGHFTEAITRAQHRPSVTVLNFCSSEIVGRLLTGRLANLIAWPSQVDDRQCCEFNDVFYRALVRGNAVGNAYDDAKITVQRWTGLVPPVLLGDPSFRPLA